jgi:hypothetical protein
MIFMPQGLTRGALDLWEKYRLQRDVAGGSLSGG